MSTDIDSEKETLHSFHIVTKRVAHGYQATPIINETRKPTLSHEASNEMRAVLGALHAVVLEFGSGVAR